MICEAFKGRGMEKPTTPFENNCRNVSGENGRKGAMCLQVRINGVGRFSIIHHRMPIRGTTRDDLSSTFVSLRQSILFETFRSLPFTPTSSQHFFFLFSYISPNLLIPSSSSDFLLANFKSANFSRTPFFNSVQL